MIPDWSIPEALFPYDQLKIYKGILIALSLQFATCVLNLTPKWYLVLYMWHGTRVAYLFWIMGSAWIQFQINRFLADVYVTHSLFMLLVRGEIGSTRYSSLFNFLCYWCFSLCLRTYQPSKMHEVVICTCSLPMIFLSTISNKRKQSLFV